MTSKKMSYSGEPSCDPMKIASMVKGNEYTIKVEPVKTSIKMMKMSYGRKKSSYKDMYGKMNFSSMYKYRY